MNKLTPKFQGEIINGKLQLDEQFKFELYIGTLSSKRVEVIVKKWRKTRSNQQNKLYWGVILKTISDYTGESIDDLHQHFKNKFLRYTGKSGKLNSCKSTTKLSTDEFSQYIERIIEWAASFDLIIPLPSDIDLENIPEYIIN